MIKDALHETQIIQTEDNMLIRINYQNNFAGEASSITTSSEAVFRGRGAKPPKKPQNSPASTSAIILPSSEIKINKICQIFRNPRQLLKKQVSEHLPTAAISHFPSWYASLIYCTTSRALALSWIEDLDPLNWKILDFVSKIKTSSWLRVDRTKGTW